MKNRQYKSYYKRFEEFRPEELYEILALRQEVFVIEQECIYQDLDGLDGEAIHFVIIEQNQKRIVAYARAFPPGVVNENKTVIGRVVVRERYRKNGFGKRIMEESIDYCSSTYPGHDIKISAQTYLESFYAALGFVDTGDHYLEDGIPHMAMTLTVWD